MVFTPKPASLINMSDSLNPSDTASFLNENFRRLDINVTNQLKKMNTTQEILALAYPVGSIYMNASSATNPATLFGFGTWVAFGEGRVPVGKATSGTFATIGATGGAETVTLSINEMPAHFHRQYANVGNVATGAPNLDDFPGSNGPISAYDQLVGGRDTTTVGGGAAHNNLQPYIVVYMWQRTA